MTNPVYNVIWVDDEIEQIIDLAGEYFKAEGINVLKTAKNYDELKTHLKEQKGKYDAVIADASFSKSRNAPMEERDFSGLTFLLDLPQEYQGIPFFVYTGRPLDIIYDHFKYGELDYFKENGHIFIKGAEGQKALVKKIKERVDECKSPEFVVRNKYRRELEIAEKISYLPKDESGSERRVNAEDKLLNWLIRREEWEEENVSEWFNPMRQLFESIFEDLKECDVLPRATKLNSLAGWLNGEIREGYILPHPDAIIHPCLAYSLSYCLTLTQDGSHGDISGLKHQVVNYVNTRKSARLFNILLDIFLDIILWYGEIMERMEQRSLPESTFERTTRLTVVQDGIEDSNGNRNLILHAGRFLVNPKYCKAGDIIDITEASTNSNKEQRDCGITHFANKFTKSN